MLKIIQQYRTAILFFILLLGFFLRAYNLDFPSIGYHNMMENEYLGMAQEMVKAGDLSSRRVYFRDAFDDGAIVKPYPNLPLVSYQILISWSVLGDNLWGPRLFNILFGIAGILLIYLISQILFADTVLSLSSALLLSMMPLGVFFSRNIQPESPAFFFMLLGSFFYLRFIASSKIYNLFLGGLSFSIAWGYKFNFLFGVLPFLFCMPFKKIWEDRKGFLKFMSGLLIPYLAIVITIVWLKNAGQWRFLENARLWEILTPSYWDNHGQAVFHYLSEENFTPVFWILTLLGAILAFLKGKSLLDKYIVGWAITAFLYAMQLSQQLYQHGFSFMPFLVLVCLSSVYLVSFVAMTLRDLIKKDIFIYLMVILIGIASPFVFKSIFSMYATIFPGVDVAGATLRELTKADERIFLLTHAQGQGIARYAQRYTGWTSDLKDFKDLEDKFNIKYICIYPADLFWVLERDSQQLYKYIQDNYHFKELGLQEESNQLVYLILEKGKGEDFKAALQSVSGKIQQRAIYNLFGRYIFFSTVRLNTG